MQKKSEKTKVLDKNCKRTDRQTDEGETIGPPEKRSQIDVTEKCVTDSQTDTRSDGQALFHKTAFSKARGPKKKFD